MKISVVSPVYMAEGLIDELVSRIEKTVGEITNDFEIILVEDQSPDQSWKEIQEICKDNPKVIGMALSRNFGQHNAITAGLDKSRGEWVIVMDCDLQDRPEEIRRLYDKSLEGHDIVLATRKFRKDNWVKKAGSKLFYSTLQYLTGIQQDRRVANFGIYKRQVVDVLVNEMRESIRYFPMMVRWLGFDVATVDVDHGKGGRPSAYKLRALLDLAFNIMLTFSDKPLRLTIRFGLLIILGSVLFGLFTIYRYLTNDISQEGWASLIISIWFMGGLIIFILGMLGLYLGKTFEEVKRRPIYIVKSVLNG